MQTTCCWAQGAVYVLVRPREHRPRGDWERVIERLHRSLEKVSRGCGGPL
jgi:hypothetical protein